MLASIGHNKDTVCRWWRKKLAQEINSIVVRYMSWIAQLVRALAWKAKGPGSNPGPG